MGFDFERLKLSQSFAEAVSVKKKIMTVPVGKPSKTSFFRVNGTSAYVFETNLLENKSVNETYLLSPEVAMYLPELVRPARLQLAVDRAGNPYLVPRYLPKEDGVDNQWHASLGESLHLATQHWLRLYANMRTGGYDVCVAENDQTEPIWPTETMHELLEIAFKNKVITSVEHPLIQELLGV